MIFYEDSRVTLHQGDALATLRELADESVQCVVTSPPYWGLRDYHVAGQLGLERTPEEYVAKIVEVFREVRRVLRKDGTLWLNMGDSYAANPKGPNGDASSTLSPSGVRVQRAAHRSAPRVVNQATKQGRNVASDIDNAPHRSGALAGIKTKDLLGIPWMVAFALRSDGWWLRSDIIWSKPNPMPESVTDRPTKAHEYLFLLSKAPRYYYDDDAIRTALRPKTYTTFGSKRHDPGDAPGLVKSENYGRDVPVRKPRMKVPDGWDTGSGSHGTILKPDAKNAEQDPRDGHRRLAERVKLARANGADHDNPLPRKDKQRGHGRRHAGFNDRWDLMSRAEQQESGANARTVWEIATQGYPEAHFATFPEALVKPCILAGCPEDGIVLDPFVGSGTTLLVAKNLNRRAIGIELSPEYCALVPPRLRQEVLAL